MARWILVLGLLGMLAGCRYTFLPLDPGKSEFPQRAMLSGTLESVEGAAIVRLNVRRIAEASYVELRWYKDDQLFEEQSIWVEKPGTYQARLKRIDDGYYRLMVLIKNSPYLQLELGSPLIPTAPPVRLKPLLQPQN